MSDIRTTWKVALSLPPRDNARYRTNKWVTCIAKTLQGAVKLVEDRYPGCSINQVNHGGAGDEMLEEPRE